MSNEVRKQFTKETLMEVLYGIPDGTLIFLADRDDSGRSYPLHIGRYERIWDARTQKLSSAPSLVLDSE